MHPQQAQNQLAARQAQIDARARRVEVGGLFAATQRELKRTEKRVSGSAAVWERVCPPELLDRTSVIGFGRGVLSIGVSDHSTKYVLDRLMRSGLESELIRRSAVAVSKVKLVVQPEVFVSPEVLERRSPRRLGPSGG